MDYEKKYNEALERARAFQEKYGGDYAGYIFPELAESEDERIRKELVAFVKENSKSADSIPSDCVSDVRCEDRWHKVGDSLPDNPREVLCEDEAGNYFIGRYYVGEGWEISNYDDEDKPHHLNPPVSKWIDFPSEKQKEPHYTKRNSLFDKCVENCDPKVMKEVSDKVDEMLGKEQKPAEWSEEDEWKRNELLKYLEEKGDYRSTWYSWLKSLRPSWKPTGEQLWALRAIINDPNNAGAEGCQLALRELYDQLPKLNP